MDKHPGGLHPDNVKVQYALILGFNNKNTTQNANEVWRGKTGAMFPRGTARYECVTLISRISWDPNIA